MTELTKRQRDVWKFLTEWEQDHGGCPLYQDLMDHFGWASANAATGHLRRLQRKGYLRIDGGPRSIRLLRHFK